MNEVFITHCEIFTSIFSILYKQVHINTDFKSIKFLYATVQ